MAKPSLTINDKTVKLQSLDLRSLYEPSNRDYRHEWSAVLASDFEQPELIRLSNRCVIAFQCFRYEAELIGFQLEADKSIRLRFSPMIEVEHVE